ncbi:123743e8-a128-49b4-b2d5-d5d1631e7edf-CDS [Sclerotinia trifoliorum]|uniref:123743e8-a128-49b4-b2d5-d5d1631e7edf-CDS n=1 Tax=Sclerotinia trifoliorum TaxID=28548 RepID=A0A8H2VM58_9HELO|nr:123743e8-a128-49b4-b2d5-d5d1631e7edf-CDS [Sclerotinia trifoliorum]
MFVSLTRRTPRLQQPYVCTSCLSKLIGASDALPLYSNAIRCAPRTPRNVAAFSTTRVNYKNENAGSSLPSKKQKVKSSIKGASGDNKKVNTAAKDLGGSLEGLGNSIEAVLKAKKKSKSDKKSPEQQVAKKEKGKKQTTLTKEDVTFEDDSKGDVKETGSESKTKGKKSTKKAKAKAKAKASNQKGKEGNEEESEARIRKVKQKLINYVNSTQSSNLVQRISGAAVDGTNQEKIAPSQLHSIYESMVAEKGEAAARKELVNLIQKGGLTTTDRTQVMKELRASLVNRPRPKKESTSSGDASSSTNLAGMLASFESIPKSPVRRLVDKRFDSDKQEKSSRKSAASAKGKNIRTGPMKKSPGTIAFEVKSVDADSLQLVPVQKKQPPVPGLSYGLERALFNPGVYHLQDPRSRVFNFDPYLQQIMPVSEFDFTALKQYVTSSRDKALIATAKDEKRKYTGSTSSMSASLAHFHFLLSQWRPINTSMLSQEFPVEFNSFTALQRGPSAVFLRERDGVYAIDADKQYDTANILSMLGKSMEKLLTLPKEEFEQYRKENSASITEDQRNEVESFHYTTMGDFLMRSQLDAHDPRLPGTGMFDLKTRAVISIRMDIENYAEGSGYEIFSRHGEYQSFEREYYDMIRAAFLKYSLQVRMGRMDGIFVAYHNVERIFGFQYISLPELDDTIHGTTNTTIGDSEFKLSVDLLNKALDRATARFPGKSLRIHFETRGNVETPFMYIFAEPMEEEEIQKIQDTNKAEIEAFEARVLGLHGAKGTEEEQLEERKNAEWEDLRAKIEESMENDEFEIKSAKEIAESLLEHHDVAGLTLDEVEQRVEEFLSTSSYNEQGEAGATGQDENELWKEEENVDADEEGDEIIDGNEEIEHDGDIEKTTAEVNGDADEENDEENDEDSGEEENEEDEEEDDEEEEEDNEEEEEGEADESDAGKELENSNDDVKISELTEIAVEETVIQEGHLVDPAEETSEAQQSNDDLLEAETHESEPVENEDLLIDSAEEISEAQQSNDESLKAETNEPELVENEDLLIDSAEETEEAQEDIDGSLDFQANSTEESETSIEPDEKDDDTSMADIESILPEEAPKEILAMHLAIRNKVDGAYTVRPEKLTKDQKWTVEYALSEIPEQEKAMNLYRACQTRRKTALRRSDEPENKWAEERNDRFIAHLKHLAKNGRAWRQNITKKEANEPVKTLEFRPEPPEVGIYEGYEEMKMAAEEKIKMVKAAEETSEENKE